MKKKSGYRFSMWFVILSGVILAITLSITSLKIIQGDKKLTRLILEENKSFLVNTLRFGHGIMAHMGAKNYESLIDEALKSQFVRYLSILDREGKPIAESIPPAEFASSKSLDPEHLRDSAILRETEDLLLISYRAEKVVEDQEHKKHHATFRGSEPSHAEPGWFLVAFDISSFRKHHNDLVIQTLGAGAGLLLLGILIIIFLGIVQRYELAHLSIERLEKIKRVLGNFVPEIAKNMIEKDPENALSNKYIQDATVLFLDIEGFTPSSHKNTPWKGSIVQSRPISPPFLI